MDELSTTEIETTEDDTTEVTQETVDNELSFDEVEDEDLDNIKASLKNESSEDKTEDTQKEDNAENDLDDLDALYKKQLENGFELKEPIAIKHNGQVLKIDDPHDVSELLQKGLDYVKKTTELAQYRKTLEFLTSNGLDDVETLQQALTQGIDPNQLNTVSNDVGSNEVDIVANQILQDPEADNFKQSISMLPDNAKQVLKSDARVLSGLYTDFKNGLAQKIMPLANQYMIIKGMPFIDAYLKAGAEINSKSESVEQSTKVLKSEPKAKGQTKRNITQKDIFEMDDKEFDKYYEKFKKNVKL